MNDRFNYKIISQFGLSLASSCSHLEDLAATPRITAPPPPAGPAIAAAGPPSPGHLSYPQSLSALSIQSSSLIAIGTSPTTKTLSPLQG
jgi:hypothetical protein